MVTPGVIVLHHLAASRLGEFRYYTNMWEWAKTCFGGPLFNFFAAIIISIIPIDNPLIHKAMIINILFAIYSLVPLPTIFPGGHMFYTMKYFWAFATVFIVSGCVLLLFTNALLAIIVGFLLGVIAMTYYFWVKDKCVG